MRISRHFPCVRRRDRNVSDSSDYTDEPNRKISLEPDRRVSDANRTAYLFARMKNGISHEGSLLSRLSSDTLDARVTMPPLFVAIQNADLSKLREILANTPELLNTQKYGGFTALHTACHGRHPTVLAQLLDHGAKIGAIDALGHTPLHLAVHEGWHEGVAELLRRGASPNVLSEPPQSVKEVRVETPLHAAILHGDLVSSSLMMRYNPDLLVRDSDQNTVLHLAAHARSADIARMLMREKVCEENVTAINREGNSVLHMALKWECDAAEEPSLMELVTLLLEKGVDPNAINAKGETPLFLASRLHCPKVVEILLSTGADPTTVTRRGQSVLHAACHSGCATSLGLLLNTGKVKHLVTQADNGNREPFHSAVHSSSIDCCELLLNNGDHLTRRDVEGESRCSLVLEHLPSATQLLRRLFDARIKISNKPQYDPDFQVTFDYSVLLSPELDEVQSSLMSELSHTRIEFLLKHPLLESFLFIKWTKIKPFFYLSVLVYLSFLLLHTSFLISKFGNKTNPIYNLTVIRCFYIFMFLLNLIPDLIIVLTNLKKYMRQWETFSKMTALATSAFVVFFVTPTDPQKMQSPQFNITGTNATETEASGELGESAVKHVAAVSAFFGWVEFMMLLGRFPSLGAYVLMFTRVAKSITKFIFAFSSLLIGFALSFMIIFHNIPVFKNFQLSLVKTLMMMIGEIEYGDLADQSEMPITSSLFLVLFLFLVCILMANLLIGLAVNDIPDLQRQGKIKRLSKQASYLVSYEKLMSVDRSLRCFFPRRIRFFLTNHFKIQQVVSIFPSRERKSRRHQQYIPSGTIQEAILLGTCEDPKVEDLHIEEEEGIARQFKSFKIKYDRDWRALTRRLSQLADCSTTDKILRERLDQMQKMMETQILHMSIQLQQHNQNMIIQTVRQSLHPQSHLQHQPQYQQAAPSQTNKEVPKAQSAQDLRQHYYAVSNIHRRGSQQEPSPASAVTRKMGVVISPLPTLPQATQPVSFAIPTAIQSQVSMTQTSPTYSNNSHNLTQRQTSAPPNQAQSTHSESESP